VVKVVVKNLVVKDQKKKSKGAQGGGSTNVSGPSKKTNPQKQPSGKR